jgi:hypothetical protein
METIIKENQKLGAEAKPLELLLPVSTLGF